MELHSKAALTLVQRREVRRLHVKEQRSFHELARRFHVSVTTAKRWATREDPNDRSCAPRHHAGVVTDELRQAAIEERTSHPEQGPSGVIFWFFR